MSVGIPLGVIAALNRGKFLDRTAGTIAVLGIATPSFWLGVMLIFIFSVELGWLPSGRMGGPAHYVLPVITLGTFLTAGFMRLTRSSMLEVMESEFAKLARIKGLSEGIVIWKHCLRNALIPLLTLWGVFVGNLITGAIVTETVFAWPGVGRLTYEAVIYRDFPLLQAVIILKSILILTINLLVDILYAYVDPRTSALLRDCHAQTALDPRYHHFHHGPDGCVCAAACPLLADRPNPARQAAASLPVGGRKHEIRSRHRCVRPRHPEPPYLRGTHQPHRCAWRSRRAAVWASS